MAKKKNEIDIEALLDDKPAEEAMDQDIKEDELVATPEEEEPLQTFANEPAQPFNSPKGDDAPKGVGGAYYIDALGKRVKRTN